MGNLCPSARCIADEQKAAFERHVRMETLFQSTPVIADERMERGTHSPHCLNRFQSTPVIADERMAHHEPELRKVLVVSIHARHC